MDTTHQPKEITLDKETNFHCASFDYYTGIKWAKANNIKQGVTSADMSHGFSVGTHFIVCCGDVMVRVSDTDYPNIVRRVI